MRKWLALMLLGLVACGEGDQAGPDLPDNIRDQLHAATGHEPEECTDLRAGEAVIEITDDGFLPACAIVATDQTVSVVNRLEFDEAWIVADAPTEAEIPRHTRMVFEVAAGATGIVEAIGDHVGSGVWPCYGRESRHQCQLVIVP